jgi:hypothetical protein
MAIYFNFICENAFAESERKSILKRKEKEEENQSYESMQKCPREERERESRQ